jgi:hypothetical protein
MANEITDNTFFEVQAEKFYQKKVEVARGVIELGKILKETRDGANNYHDFEQWLDDRRVNFKRHQANKYIKIYEELGLTESRIFDDLSLNKLYTLASAPEEVKEDVANSKDKEEAEKKIKEYEEQLKQEKLAKDVLIKNNQQLQEQLEREKKTKKTEYITNEVVVEPSDYSFIKDRLHELECSNKALEYTKESLFEELEKIKNSNIEKDEQLKQYEQLNRKLNELGIGMEIRDQYLEDTTELASLVGSMRYFFNEKLAPVKYERCLKYYKCDNSVVKSLRDIIEKTEDWLVDIKQYLPESNLDNTVEIIDVEVK